MLVAHRGAVDDDLGLPVCSSQLPNGACALQLAPARCAATLQCIQILLMDTTFQCSFLGSFLRSFHRLAYK